jgi:hypothetical protein
MTAYISLPALFIRFWFIEAPLAILRYYGHINTAFLQFFALPMMIKTFFKPLKNEYREGLVGFSIGMGIVVKTVLILFTLFLLGFILTLEAIFLVFFILLPFLSFSLLAI